MRVILCILGAFYAVVGLAALFSALVLPSTEKTVIAAIPFGVAVYLFLAASQRPRHKPVAADQGAANAEQRVREQHWFAFAVGILLPTAASGAYLSFDVFRTDMPFGVLAMPILCGLPLAVGLPALFIAHGVRHARAASATSPPEARSGRWSALALVLVAAYAVVFWLGWSYAVAANRGPVAMVTPTQAALVQAAAAWVALLLVAWLSPGRKWSVAFSAYLFLLAVSLCVSALTGHTTRTYRAEEAIRLCGIVTLLVTPVLPVVWLLFGRR